MSTGAASAGSGSARLAGFDGLRALAAFAIVAFHAASFSGATRTNRFGDYFARLDVAVTIFYVVSAFLLYRPFVASHFGERGRVSPRSFWWRRAVRIFPAYWVALTVVLFVFDSTHRPADLGAYVRAYGLVHVYPWRADGIIPAWTLAVELSFYALLPLYAWVMSRVGAGSAPARRMRIELVGVACVFVAGIASRLVITTSLGTDTPWARVLLPTLDWFALGLLLAVVHAGARAGVRPRSAARLAAVADARPWLCWGAALLAFAATGNVGLPTDGGSGTVAQDLARELLFGVVGVSVVAPVALATSTRGRRLLVGRPAVALGSVSYGVFLWHFDWIERLGDWGVFDRVAGFQTLQVLVAAVAVSTATATVSWLAVERPLLRRSRSVAGVGTGVAA